MRRQLLASIVSLLMATPSLAAWVTPTVGVYDENDVNTNTVDAEAGGANSPTLADFKTIVQSAFDMDRGGVINFDQGTYEADQDAGVPNAARAFTLTSTYGQSQTKSVSFTTPGVDDDTSPEGFNPDSQSVPISGNQHMGIFNQTGISFESSTPLTHVAITGLARTGDRRATLIATLLDGSEISTNEAAVTNSADGLDVFFALEAPNPLGNPIVGFRIEQNTYIRYDDLGFVTVPEPSTVAMLGVMGIVGVLSLRSRVSKRAG